MLSMNSYLLSAPFRQTTFWKVVRAIFGGVVFLHVLFAATQITVRWDRFYIDTITGSKEYRTEWITGWKSTRTQTSPLEERLTRARIHWKRDLVFVSGTYSALFGNTTCHACGAGSDMYFLDHDVMRTWADA